MSEEKSYVVPKEINNINDLLIYAYNQLLEQGQCSFIEENEENEENPFTDSCAYRHPDGLKCAIGFMISDEYYGEDLEGLDVYSLKLQRALNLSLSFHPIHEELQLLNTFQKIHDSLTWTDSGEEFRKEFKIAIDEMVNSGKLPDIFDN